MMRLPYTAVLCLLTFVLSACWHYEAHAREVPVEASNVCDLSNWGEARVGTRVRLQAEYFTDLRHGAFLSDERCPSHKLMVGADAENADQSLAKFDDFTVDYSKFYTGRKFKIDITGIFEWSKEKIINAELPPDRQMRIPAHGEISILKVWSFEKPNSHGSR